MSKLLVLQNKKTGDYMSFTLPNPKYQYALADCGGTKWVTCTREEWENTPPEQRRINGLDGI